MISACFRERLRPGSLLKRFAGRPLSTNTSGYVPSATLLLTRPGPGASYEVLLQGRGSGFMKGAYAFPGGVIDGADKKWDDVGNFRTCCSLASH